jgi:lysophospholipase L1-like esterase
MHSARKAGRLALLTGTLLAVTAVMATAGSAAMAASKPVPLPLPNAMAATGDSISRGFNADTGTALTDTPQYSWSTGTPGITFSHYLRILRRNPAIRDHAYNDALAGTKMADLQGQLTAAAGQRVGYATVLMGANDACGGAVSEMTPTALFGQQFRNALGAFFKADPSARILVSSIPDVGYLWTQFSGRPEVVQLWTTYGICTPILSANSSATDRAAAQTRITEYNATLAAVCGLYGRCKFDGYATYRFRFTPDLISTVDYFHPNLAGQRALAAITWSKGWWPTR